MIYHTQKINCCITYSVFILLHILSGTAGVEYAWQVGTKENLPSHRRSLQPKKTQCPFFQSISLMGDISFHLFSWERTRLCEAITQHLYIFSTNHVMSKSALHMYLTDVLKTDSPTILFIFQHHIRRRKNWSNISLFQIYKYNVCVNDCVV